MFRNFLYILTTFISGTLAAQVNLYSEVNTREARLNNPIIFTIVLEVYGDDQIQETPLKLPDFSKFNYDYASEQNTYIDPVRKIRINKMAYQFYLDPKQAGNLRIGSALVKINGKIYKTEPIDIVVKDVEKKPTVHHNNLKHMYVNMQVDEREVYKNQPVIAVLKAYSKAISNFRTIERARMGHSNHVAVRAIADFNEEIEENAEAEYSSQVIGMYVVVPKVAGVVEVPSCEVTVGNKAELVSNKVKINVKKLPEGAPENFKNAVGNYDLKVELIDKSKENFEVNKAFNVVVKLTGNGNMSPSLLPKLLPSPNYETFEPKIINNTLATPKGIVGEIEAQYVIIPKVRGDIQILTEEFSYFDPKEEKYVNLGQKSLMLTALSSQDIANAKSTIQKVNDYTNTVLKTVDSSVIRTEALKVKDDKKVNWGAIVGNFLLMAAFSGAIIFFYRRHKKNKKTKVQQKNIKKKPVSNIQETEEMLRKTLFFDLDSHLQYLESLKNQNFGNFFDAVEQLQREANEFCQNRHQQNFEQYLQNQKGVQPLEEYKQLLTKIQIEKYSPYRSEENLNQIISELRNLYSAIEN